MITIRVEDVQDTPPVFTSSPNAIVVEGSAANTLVMAISVQDGDAAAVSVWLKFDII